MRKTHTSEAKAEIVLEALRGGQNLSNSHKIIL